MNKFLDAIFSNNLTVSIKLENYDQIKITHYHSMDVQNYESPEEYEQKVEITYNELKDYLKEVEVKNYNQTINNLLKLPNNEVKITISPLFSNQFSKALVTIKIKNNNYYEKLEAKVQYEIKAEVDNYLELIKEVFCPK